MKTFYTILSIAALTLLALTPNWKSALASQSPYAIPVYVVSSPTLKESISVSGCGRNITASENGGSLTLFDDNTASLVMVSNETVILSGSWYQSSNKSIMITLDGTLNSATGNTGAYYNLVSHINGLATAECATKDASAVSSVIEPTLITKIRMTINPKNSSAKLVLSTKGLTSSDVNGSTNTSKISYKSTMKGLLVSY